jgi:biotin/methionine sulfoxide reductase
VRLFNEIGACLASAHLCEEMREDVVQLPTGAWYDPTQDDQGRPMCAHGNPNVLTRDIGTSSLTQGCAGQLSTVQIERYIGALPPIRAFDPPQDAGMPAQRVGPKLMSVEVERAQATRQP